MNYEQAKKAVQTAKKPDNYFIIKLEYNEFLVLPHKAGLAFLDAVGQGEVLRTPYSDPHRIEPIHKDRFEISLLSAEHYEAYKIAALLGISHTEVEAAKKGELTPT